MKKIDMVAIGTIAMVACLLFCTPALADYNFDGFSVVTRDSGTVNGGMFVDYVPWASTTTLTGNFNVPTGNIAWARLYTGIWGGTSEYEGWVKVTFNGVDDTNELGPIHLQGANDANPNVWCSGNGKYWMYYDVSDVVNAGAVNTATTMKINETVGDFDGRVYGIVLVVVYEGGDNPKNIQYWINDGSDGLNYVDGSNDLNYVDGSNDLNYDTGHKKENTGHKKKIRSPNSARVHNDGTTDFAGSVAGSVTDAELTMVHLTAYDPLCDNCLQFNGAALDTSMITSDTFALNSWDVASHVESSGNDALYSRGEDGYVNVCNAILTLELEELPDLVVEKGVEIGPDGKFIVSYTVTNIGGGEAGESTMCKYVDGVLQETKPCPALAPDESHSGTFDPEECPCGETLNVTVCADNAEEVDESDETNNCEVNFVDCPPCKPDLVVGKGVEIGPDGKFIVSYTVTNIGGGDAGPSTTCKYVDGELQETKPCPALVPDASHSGAFDPEECPCGETLNVTVCADNEDVVNESKEDNNCEVNFVDCPLCKPDLVVGKGVEIGPDGKFIVSYTVTNIGGGDAGPSTTCKYVDGELQETQDCPALIPDASHSGVFDPEECPCGETLNVTVCADNEDVVNESNEDNNCEVNFVDCPPCKPDLVVGKVVEIGPDGKFIVSYTVTNIGDGSAGESTMCKYVDGVLQETQTCPALAPDESHSGAFDSEDCPCGETLNVTVCADNEKVVDESDETNNCEMNFVDCPPCKPDLVVEKSVTIENGNFTVNYTVTNIGIGTANESSTCKYVDGERKETQTCPVLGPGESHNGTFVPESCPCGATLNVTICADNEKVVDESDETNNCEVNFVDCPPCKPDLEIVDKWEEWVNETHYNVSYVIHNNGTAIAPACHNTTLYVDGVAIEHKHVPVDLAHCETYTDTFDTTIECTEGFDIIMVCADNYNVIDELDETNNCLENEWICKEKKAVAKPDLNVTEITVNYDASSLGGRAVGPEPGQGVHTECNNLSAVIEEKNGVDVGAPFDVTFEVDGTTRCTVNVPSLAGGTTKTVYCNCSWYPYAGNAFAINVTVDSNHEIPESDETNNTKWNNGTVISNGYKGDGWQGPDRNLINEQCHDQDTINLTYSVGDSEYVSGSTHWTEYAGSWTTSDLPVPDGATIQKAMLYVYYTWDKNDVMPDNVSLAFNGNNIAFARHYSDSKGFGSYDFPSGMLVYDVHSHFTATGPNNAILTKAVASDEVSMRGMLLMVIYKHPDEPERIIYIDEGYDMLYAKDSYAVTSEEATTYAPFTRCEPVPIEKIGKATLIAVAPSASDGDDMNRLSFNDGLWQGAWSGFAGATQLGIAEANVLAYLKQTENRANFQSHIPAGGDKGDFMDASNAFLILEKRPKPDLNVTEITVNYDASSLGGRAVGPEPGQGVHTECNNLSAVIEEKNGVDVGAPFDVTFEVDGTTRCTVNVPSLAGGTTKTVYCNCSWYPYAGNAFAINVTVDSNHEIPESDETNNTKWNNGTVISNGYKGDGWQGPDRNLINEQCHDQDTINLTYSVGDSEYVSGSTHWTEYAGSWTTSDLPVPDGATIQKAMLYVYYTWDKNDVMPDNVSLAFNGNNIAFARHYSDSKGFGSYDFPSGMLIYDVHSHFAATGPNNAILTKAVASDEVSMRGMLLMVIYKHPDEPERIIYIDEGYDMLYAKDSYAVTSEEATTYAPFTRCEPVPIEKIGKATLIAVAPSASDGDDMNRLSFNDGLWQGAWSGFAGATQLGIAEANVLAYLKQTENRANFQSHIPAGGDKGDFMDASNAFLILEKRPKPDLNVTEITVNYDASSLGGRAVGPEPGQGVHTECNNLSAVIEEKNGVDVGAPFDVTFEVDGTTRCTVNVPSLAGGTTKTVYCNCSWYPYAGNAFAINVTVDSNHEIPESDETNNTKWNNGTVISNGYKGDGWQGPDRNLINEQCHDQDTINLTYSVGDSEYVSGSTHWTEYAGSWTTSDLPVPDGATIQKAMLYVYYTWDKNDVMPDNVSLAFNGNNIAFARHYSDSKGFGSYDFPSGMLIYDVHSHFAATGPNNAILTKAVASDEVSMRGMLLMVIYKHPDEPERIIYIDEGYDMLYAKDSYAVTSEEATTYAPFTRCEPVPIEKIGKATLIAVAPSASDGDDMNRLSFNDGLWQGAWSGFAGATQLGIAEANVLAYLKQTENRANFQSHIPAGGDKGDFMDASNAFLILEKRPKPDLNVTEITVNYDASSLGGRAVGPEPGQGVHTECNNLSAVIEEKNGVDVGAPFDVTFEVDGTTRCTVNVPSLAGGTTKTVYCNCSWYPYAGNAFAINVTVDSNHEIPESDETNNTKWNNGTVISNGYKGDGWQGPDRNLINEQCHDQDTINLTYSVGDSEYVSGSTHWTEYAGSWTTSDLPVPDGATIQKAMLYVYYTWDKNDVMPDNVSLAFNGNNIAFARHYSDSKGFGSYDFPSGMLIYDVHSHFAATGPNNAILTKAVASDEVSMRGMLLMVIYKHPDEPERIIYIDEGYDMLYAKDSYAVTSEEATTYAPFTRCEPVPIEKIGKATLIAVAPSASDGDDMNRLSFNDGLWQGAWSGFAGATQLGIAEANVLAYLKQTENRANFQSHIPAGGDKGDFMDASNAFLILEKRPKPDLNVTEITVNYDASSLGGRAVGPEPGQGVHTECNNLSAVIEEKNGVDVGAPFDVTFEVDGTTRCTVNVPSLAGGTTKTVYCNCSWYPYAGNAFAINVTVDSNHEIPESDETNNTKWNNGTVISNGYKGDGWQGPDRNLINEQCHDQDTINLTYSVGDSEYVSGSTHWTEYAGSWTTSDLPVPDGATIQKAMLYVYYTWDKNDVMPDNVSLAFNGNNIAFARHYSDSKGFGSYDFPSGMLIYDVHSHFAATGPNNAILTKAVASDEVSMRGMLLMVIYKHPDEPERIIYIDEGYDMLYAKDSYAVTSEEATTYAPFTRCEPVPIEKIGKATLIAVAPSASDGDDMNRLSFNDGLWQGAWSGFAGATQLGIAEANVLAYLKQTENRANFQSHIPAGGDKGDFMDASNAFLILEKKEVPCPAKYAVYQAKVSDPEGRLNELRALRDKKLEDGYVTRYYDYSPALTLVLSRADPDLVKDGAQLLSRYSIPVGLHVQGLDVGTPITKQDVEEALSFTERLKREVMKNRDAIGVESTEAIIVFIDEFEGQVKASEGKTFSEALKSSIYYEDERSRVYQEIEEK